MPYTHIHTHTLSYSCRLSKGQRSAASAASNHPLVSFIRRLFEIMPHPHIIIYHVRLLLLTAPFHFKCPCVTSSTCCPRVSCWYPADALLCLTLLMQLHQLMLFRGIQIQRKSIVPRLHFNCARLMSFTTYNTTFLLRIVHWINSQCYLL